ncbi:hypothetical protein G4B88_020567 [Cannabis sativa]|uniref:Uncharacterized protein n=1 Tax=Cannabis sativa TaxID=3483 RepID=A0A7J6DQZ9_CANSA|nr:hypothetical protein G4B88_020567 [Cannabis sativa]
MPKDLNTTTISLILKTNAPTSPVDYRSISCYNTLLMLNNDPNIEVHGITFGPEFMQVWVDNVISPNTYFFRPSHSKITIQEVVDSFSAWPLEKIWNVWNTLAKVKKKMRSPSSSHASYSNQVCMKAH